MSTTDFDEWIAALPPIPIPGEFRCPDCAFTFLSDTLWTVAADDAGGLTVSGKWDPQSVVVGLLDHIVPTHGRPDRAAIVAWIREQGESVMGGQRAVIQASVDAASAAMEAQR
jgi:hypothetical protein